MPRKLETYQEPTRVESCPGPCRSVSIGHWLAGALTCCVLAGCTEEIGSFEYPSVRVTGQVLFDGAPVHRGWIEFHPTQSTVGTFATAEIGPDGRYTAARVPVGQNFVKIVETSPPLPAKYSSHKSILTFETQPGTENSGDFDLAP